MLTRGVGALRVLATMGTLATTGALAMVGAPSARAQDVPDEVASDQPVIAAPEAPTLEERLARLEARDEARTRELEEARARVAALEAEAGEEAVAPTAATGPTLRPLASMLTRFEHREGYDALGSPRSLATAGCYGGAGMGPVLADSDCMRYRTRAGFEITGLQLGDDVTAVVRFLPQVSGFWAMGGFTLGGPGGFGTSSSGGTVDALLGLHEGSLALQIGTAARIEIGRFEMAYGEHVVIGNLDWHPNARAFDGARVRITPTPSSYWIDAFWTLVNEGHAVSLTGASTGGGFGQADQSFYGLYAGLGPLLDVRPTTALDVYALFLQTNNRVDVAATTEREWSLRVTLGSRFRYRVEAIDVRVEGALQTGREGALRSMPANAFGPSQAVLAGFVIGEVGLSLLEDHLRIALEGNFASGNRAATCATPPCVDDVNEGYQHLFPTAHAFLGFTDVMGARTNVGSGVLHLAYRPLDQLALNLDWHVFVVPERPATARSHYAGQEGNLNVVWTPWTGFRARAMYGVFLPETAYFRPTGAPSDDTDAVHYVEVELAYVLR
ncbi:MAG: hypothetical protein OHK0013_34370 [Sandaracinaceae bacterium]